MEKRFLRVRRGWNHLRLLNNMVNHLLWRSLEERVVFKENLGEGLSRV
jgi:hypothetical protein